MAWRVAKSLERLLAQINEAWPDRSKISDGSIGDPAHSARESDHNPNTFGVVCARDFTHDPAQGADMALVAEGLRGSRDPRIKYVIFQGRLFSSYRSGSREPWEWGTYSGVNAHTQHMHVSVQTDYDNTADWQIRKDWFDVATEAEVRKIIREELEKAFKVLAVGKTQKGYDPDKINLKAAIEKGK